MWLSFRGYLVEEKELPYYISKKEVVWIDSFNVSSFMEGMNKMSILLGLTLPVSHLESYMKSIYYYSTWNDYINSENEVEMACEDVYSYLYRKTDYKAKSKQVKKVNYNDTQLSLF